jgi:acetolactate synthase-1/2/3 large subunit
LLSGQCKTTEFGKGAFQELEQEVIARPLTKAAWVALDPERLDQDIAKAFRIALGAMPGPVHVSLPTDILEAKTERNRQEIEREAFQPKTRSGKTSLVDKALSLLSQAQCPLVLAGPAMLRAKHWADVMRFSAATHLPVLPMESPRGIQDPLLGKMAEQFPKADAVLLLGKNFDFTVNYGQPPVFAPTCRFIQVHPNPSRNNKLMMLHIPGDPRVVIGQLIEKSELYTWESESQWTAELDQARNKGREKWKGLQRSGEVPIHPLRLLHDLRPFFRENTVFVSDGGEFGQWAQAALSTKFRLINGPSGTVGCAIPIALGAKLACPGAHVIALMGDGAFGFHALEFDTAVRYSLPFIAIVGNDAAWNSEKQIQIKKYGAERAVGCDLLGSRYDLLVKALGGHGEYVRVPEEFAPAMKRAIESRKPACINVNIQGVPAP